MLTKDNVKLISYLSEDYQKELNEEFKVVMDKVHKEKRMINGATMLIFLLTSLIFYSIAYLTIGETVRTNNDHLLVISSGLVINVIVCIIYRKMLSREKGGLYKDEVTYFYLRQINHSSIKFIEHYFPLGEVQILKKFKDEDYVMLNIVDDKKRNKDSKVALVMNIIDSDRNELELYNDHIDAYINRELQLSIQ